MSADGQHGVLPPRPLEPGLDKPLEELTPGTLLNRIDLIADTIHREPTGSWNRERARTLRALTAALRQTLEPPPSNG